MVDLKGMGSKWRKAKLLLGLNSCLYVPKSTLEDDSFPYPPARLSDAVSLSQAAVSGGSSTPTPSSSGLRLSKSGTKSTSKNTCAICLTTIKPGQGHAIFTAECSHSFHFHCITSSVKHGSQVCPICRAKWKEIPFQNPGSDNYRGRPRIIPPRWSRDDAWTPVLRRAHAARPDTDRHVSSFYHAQEPAIFDDDEILDHGYVFAENGIPISTKDVGYSNSVGKMVVETYPEVSTISKSTSYDNFNVLIHLKAPNTRGRHNSSRNNEISPPSQNSRAPVDLVTVLDVSGSMAGTKLALLKRAMGFVIQNLGPSDRLSVISFSSTARRLFPLRHMTENGRQEALQSVNSLISIGGTNIAEGLRKGAQVIMERKLKSPVASIILLSDGQDTYTVTSPGGTRSQTDYKSLLPHQNGGTGFQIPVHAFGFGTDHDADAMHSISEISGGTFSFIEAENVIQDAFAQCIGGLLSIVVQDLQVQVDCVHPSLQVSSIKAGSYTNRITADSRVGYVDVGYLYAEEERDFLVTLNIPADGSSNEMSLLSVKCRYRDPITKGMISVEGASEVKVQRPDKTGVQVVSVEVERQQNRIRAAEAMAEARVAAENGDLSRAVSVLDVCFRALSETATAKAGDRLCAALCAELKEMQERMSDRQVYETSGRAYVLSGLSSHSWQRATARGDSTDSASLVQAYQTSSMVDMVTRSQTLVFGNPSNQRRLRSALSFPAAKLEPR
ncbi:hypothetical protein K2173_016489 [Erythroxylum novogranatense]|uniref:Uncharacterized protein n=1 Tax=Erythroxylum novogranatense TaxID=1862640 RepID=A0AAV8SGH4_9ROSI|nr:hypothetical protein K2173_016489 [Erythroxylum novogranatense]